jgi:type IV pilus assembly protein PilV
MKARNIQRKPSGSGSIRGVAMIEALVAILIFVFGVLGIVGLQASMTRAQTSSKFRADASNLVSELIGLLWVDQTNMNLGKYSTANCTTYQPCVDWKNKVATTLPGGAVIVTTDSASGAVQVKLNWTVPNEGTHTYETLTNISR